MLVLEERTRWLARYSATARLVRSVNITQVERISPNQANWAVKNDNTSVPIGGDVVQTRPTVEGVRLVRGTQVHVIGQEVRDLDGSIWLPIDPRRVRYATSRQHAAGCQTRRQDRHPSFSNLCVWQPRRHSRRQAIRSR